MVLGFKERFTKPILDKTKIHTIRSDEKNRWKKGNTINFATGVRTKNYKEFLRGRCVSTQTIEIRWGNPITIPNYAKVFIDGRYLTEQECNELAINDGFTDRLAFFTWEAWNKKDFKGKIIHWTDKKY